MAEGSERGDMVAEGAGTEFAVKRLKKRSWFDPREGHWPMPLYAAGVSLASSFRMAPVFGCRLRERAFWIVVGAVGSCTVASLNWYWRIKHQEGPAGYWLSNPKADVARAAVNAACVSAILPAFVGGYAVGRMSREVRYTGREIFIYAGPIYRYFVRTRIGFILGSGACLLGLYLMQSYVNHHLALREQHWQSLKELAPPPAAFVVEEATVQTN